MKKKILVTGGAGCIGIAISKQLKNKGYKPIIYDLAEKFMQLSEQKVIFDDLIMGSILDESRLSESMKDCSAIIHLAAYLGVNRTEIHPERCLDINIQGSKNVIDIAIRNNIHNLVMASSSEVYGEPLENIVSETSITQGKTVYGVSKLAAEEYLKAAALDSSKTIRGIILRYFNTFGPHQIGAFAIPKFISNIQNGKNVIVNGKGNQLRSYCYVQDTAKATVLSLEYCMKKKFKYEIFNVGNPSNKIKIKDLANLIYKIMKPKKSNVKIIFDKTFLKTDRKASREINIRLCNISKAKKYLGFKPSVSLIEGLKKTINSGSILSDWPINN